MWRDDGDLSRQASGLALSDEAQDLLFRAARTASTFTDEPVTDDQLRAIYDLVKYAPTSMNHQPLRMQWCVRRKRARVWWSTCPSATRRRRRPRRWS